MRKEKALENLEKMKMKYEELINIFPNSGVDYKVIALDYAINKVKKDKSYMGSYWEGAWHMFLLILIIKIIDVLMTVFWG